MYDWLAEALADGGTVITANRRLARVLGEAYALRRQADGALAWPTPQIEAWPDWLDAMLREVRGQEAAPTRINHHHSALLWDQSLRRELGDDIVGAANLVRLARDTWQRLADWNVGIRDVARHAQSRDHKVFAAAAGRYLGRLERAGWIDDAGLADFVHQRLRDRRLHVAGRFTFAGFDRDRPAVRRIRDSLAELGCRVVDAPAIGQRAQPLLQAYADADAELRAAGAWARERLERTPGARVGIVVGGLERGADRMARLVREGLIPGYRWSEDIPPDALNVSYGRALVDYPAIAVGLLWLRWLARDLRAIEVGHLLRSPLLGNGPIAGRARLDTGLRGLTDREWSPSLLRSALQGREETPDASDWLRRVAALTKMRRELPAHATPAAWAVLFDDALRAAGWPGQGTLDSADFQLVNRWRDLLNDLARMDVVSPRMSLHDALRQLEGMAAEAVFQPESNITQVHLLGPLEASGIEFDAIWLAGLTAARWPPPANPSVLVARSLQQAFSMPDAVPADTVEAARRLLSHLAGAAPKVVCSYPLQDDDADQRPSELLLELAVTEAPPFPDPGWYAASQPGTQALGVVDDRVPPITGTERLAGGASTIQNQLTDPFTAFAGGRLGIRTLEEQVRGLPALLRGNLVHDALYRLYIDRPSRDELAAWHDVEQRIAAAIDSAFARHERQADTILRQLLSIERRRVAGLLREFHALELQRDAFIVADVERKLDLTESGAVLELRIDRIDRLADGRVVIIDYKTGAEKKFLDRQGNPREIQLIAYACAVDEPVAGLALANIDSRVVGFSGAGAGFGPVDDWVSRLAGWSHIVQEACAGIARGDVSVNGRQSLEDARPLNLLSRFTELRHDA